MEPAWVTVNGRSGCSLMVEMGWLKSVEVVQCMYIGSVVEVGLAQMVVEMDVQVHILK